MGTQHTNAGLYRRGKVWHIDKQIRGERVRRSTETTDRAEAEKILRLLTSRPSKWDQLVKGSEITFAEAALRWAEDNAHLRSLDRDLQDLPLLYTFIGELPLKQIHQGTIEPYLKARRDQGISSSTVIRALSTVKRVLVASHTIYRDEWGDPWLDHVPQFVRPSWSEPRATYPISLGEQACLLDSLSGDLRDLILLQIHTGLRDAEARQLKWEFEQPQEQGCLVFLLPAQLTKNKRPRLVWCNAIARQIIDARRDQTKVYIFEQGEGKCRGRTSAGRGWRDGRVRADALFQSRFGRESAEGFRRLRVHDMRHTFGERLRVAGVTLDACGDLLGHVGRGVTAHYCRAQNPELIDAVKRLEAYRSPQNPHTGNVVPFREGVRY